MNTIDDLINHAEGLMVTFLNERCKQMTADDIKASGLDPRAFSRHYTWYNENDIITVAGSRKSLDYYGGFEYISDDCVRTFGDYVIYSREQFSDDCRVSRVLDGINFANADEHDEDEESTESVHSHDMYGDRGGLTQMLPPQMVSDHDDRPHRNVHDDAWNSSEGQGA